MQVLLKLLCEEPGDFASVPDTSLGLQLQSEWQFLGTHKVSADLKTHFPNFYEAL